MGIFDTGEAAGALYIVTELISGESLRALLRRGPIPVRKIVDLGSQIADGLAAAHSRGIVHRDLKPENVMITPGGRAKILDFGLARQQNPAAPSSSETQIIATNLTEPGAVFGTAAYMSPEQARGVTLDYRTDQFSFGLMLYELASGTQAFSKASTVETLAAIIRDEATPLPGTVPAPLRWIVERCLAKEPHGRYDSTRDLYQELSTIRDHLSDAYSSSSAPSSAPARRSWRGWQIATIVFAGVSLLLLGALAFLLSRPRTDVDLSKITYQPLAVDPSGQYGPVWSADGKAIAFYRVVNRKRTVFVRYLNSPAEIPLALPYQSMPLRWSLDGQRLYITSEIADMKFAILAAPVIGGAPEHVVDIPDDFPQCDVSPRETSAACIVRSPGHGFTIAFSVPLGSAFHVDRPDPFADNITDPVSLRYSQNGSRLLYIHHWGRWKFWDIPVGTKASPRLLSVPVPGDIASCSWLPDNRHVVVSARIANINSGQLWIADTSSSEAYQITQGLTGRRAAEVAPDGKTIVYENRQDNFDIVSLNLGPPWTPQKLIATERSERMPSWAAHGGGLVYVTDRDGPDEIWLRTRDGTDRRIVSKDDFRDPTMFFMDPVFSPDEKRVLFTRVDQKDDRGQFWIMALEARQPMRLNEGTNFNEFGGSWSPDGSSIVGLDNERGVNRVVVQRVGQSSRQIIARGWLSIPEWSPTGEWISFLDEKGRWRLITPDGKMTKDLPLVKSDHLAFSHDGKRLYAITSGEAQPPTLVSIDLASNRLTELHELEPEYAPATDVHPGIRFSVSPDSRALTYSVAVRKSNLWLLRGFPQPASRFHFFSAFLENQAKFKPASRPVR